MTKEKTLSQQICELCGMKPKEINKHNCPDVNCVTFSDDKYCEICWRRYPDFENPKNFVKLLELDISNKTTPATLWGYFCDKNKSLSLNREEFLQMLRIHLKREKFKFKCQEMIQANVKQSIRDYDDWVWG